MNNWLDHYLKKNPEKPKARLTFRGEYQPLDKTDPKQKKSKPKKKKLDKVDHAIMLHEGSNVPDKDRNSPAFDSDATPIVLWEDKILGALENEFEAHKKVYHHNPSTLPLTDTLGMCLPQVRKYVRISGVPYIILGDGRVITGMVWGTAGGDAGRTAGASFYRKWAEQDKTSEFLGKKSDTSERGEHICHALSTYSKAADSEEAVEEPSAGSIPTRELLAFFIWMALRDRGYLL
ncbi:hypothetical protein PUNSTDRAFT_122875 [Punctularia strigosozonata HHB-11173 SS5]|uniref:Uncharacterized protein n=1 Tax=Punctularia strigosozonata (strain HHB-11173) TaxID=741275 RepID=R7S4U3_PUNST|nr:uncharacterized protein PUNSTDRAFT_122875 [Punctularia strigosozonata HHB-11173 SS5]EIN04281.1 hypothetical protein PUNSTDRAFT_122875 [Punctularia strigosozonata HHB-11173 SS5]